MSTRIFLFVSVVMFMCVSAFAMCGVCGSSEESKGEAKCMFLHAAKEAGIKDGVREWQEKGNSLVPKS